MSDETRLPPRYLWNGTYNKNLPAPVLRCDCGGTIYRSNCTCGSCGKVTIAPMDGE